MQPAAPGDVEGLFEHPDLFDLFRRIIDTVTAVAQGRIGKQAGGKDIGLGSLHRAALKIGEIGARQTQAHRLGLGKRCLCPY